MLNDPVIVYDPAVLLIVTLSTSQVNGSKFWPYAFNDTFDAPWQTFMVLFDKEVVGFPGIAHLLYWAMKLE